MMTMSLRAFLVGGLLIATISDPAEAGLRGKTLGGTFTTSTGGEATSCMRFNEDGTLDWTRRFSGGDSASYTGTYEELDLVIVSFYSMELTGTQTTATGLGILGIMCTFNGREGATTASGFYSLFQPCEPPIPTSLPAGSAPALAP